MFKKLQSMLFPHKEEPEQLKILLVHKNLKLTDKQRVLLMEHVQTAVESFILDELTDQPNPLTLLLDIPQKKRMQS